MTTILQPTKGVSELRRVGPAEVRERYGVDPAQVPTSSRSAATRPTGSQVPAAWVRRPQPRCSGNTARSRLLIAAGRFAAEADALLAYRHIATFDCSAPLPEIEDLEPDWGAGAAAAHELGLGVLAGRLEEAAVSRR